MSESKKRKNDAHIDDRSKDHKSKKEKTDSMRDKEDIRNSISVSSHMAVDTIGSSHTVDEDSVSIGSASIFCTPSRNPLHRNPLRSLTRSVPGGEADEDGPPALYRSLCNSASKNMEDVPEEEEATVITTDTIRMKAPIAEEEDSEQFGGAREFFDADVTFHDESADEGSASISCLSTESESRASCGRNTVVHKRSIFRRIFPPREKDAPSNSHNERHTQSFAQRLSSVFRRGSTNKDEESVGSTTNSCRNTQPGHSSICSGNEIFALEQGSSTLGHRNNQSISRTGSEREYRNEKERSRLLLDNIIISDIPAGDLLRMKVEKMKNEGEASDSSNQNELLKFDVVAVDVNVDGSPFSSTAEIFVNKRMQDKVKDEMRWSHLPDRCGSVTDCNPELIFLWPEYQQERRANDSIVSNSNPNSALLRNVRSGLLKSIKEWKDISENRDTSTMLIYPTFCKSEDEWDSPATIEAIFAMLDSIMCTMKQWRKNGKCILAGLTQTNVALLRAEFEKRKMSVEQAVRDATMCFVTVGTTLFEDLINTVLSEHCLENLKKIGVKKIKLQIGEGNFEKEVVDRVFKGVVSDEGSVCFEELEIDYYRFKKSITDDMADALVVIGHAGTCQEALALHLPFITVINDKLMDNHQAELAVQLSDEGYLLQCTPETLHSTILKDNLFSLRQFVAPNNK